MRCNTAEVNLGSNRARMAKKKHGIKMAHLWHKNCEENGNIFLVV
jgi:hypothetical protein